MSVSPADVIRCFTDVIPAPVSSHHDFDRVLCLLHSMDPDVAHFCYYIEWNLRSGEIAVTFTFSTTLGRRLRIRFWDLIGDFLGDASARKSPGQLLLNCVCRRVQATPLDSLLFPRAVSMSLESIGVANRSTDVDFVFLDYGPVLDLSRDPEKLREAFAFLEPVEPEPSRDRSLTVLDRMGAGLELAHIGLGWRREVCYHKVYLRGRLCDLVDAVLRRGKEPLLGRYLPELKSLAEDAGERTSHLVVDAEDGEVARVGFELNFDLVESDGYADLATATSLWTDSLTSATRGGAEELMGRGVCSRPLKDGLRGSLRMSHLKLSFDGSGEPEWKAYLCFQKAPKV